MGLSGLGNVHVYWVYSVNQEAEYCDRFLELQ